MSAQRTMIEVSNLHKHYGPIRAVNGISFSIDRGEIVGFLGPNGAGKSTTMKILTCYIAPTHGAVRVAGYDIYSDSMNVRRRVGYLPEDTPLYKSMTVIDFLKYVAAVREVPSHRVTERLRAVVDVCGVYDVLGQIIGTLSKGYRQRVGLAQALIHDPDILILDEPTTGLDPNQIIEIRNVIKELGEEKTLILSTHILPEVEATCDRVIIIDRGVVVGDGSQADLAKARKAQSGFMITLEGKGGEGEMKAALEKLKDVKSVAAAAAHEGNTFIVTPEAGQDPRLELMRLCVDNSWIIQQLTGHMASLEDIFRELTQKGGLVAAPAPAEDEDDEDEDEEEDEEDEDDSEEEEEDEDDGDKEEEKKSDGDDDDDDDDDGKEEKSGDGGDDGDDGDEEKK